MALLAKKIFYKILWLSNHQAMAIGGKEYHKDNLKFDYYFEIQVKYKCICWILDLSSIISLIQPLPQLLCFYYRLLLLLLDVLLNWLVTFHLSLIHSTAIILIYLFIHYYSKKKLREECILILKA